MKFADVVTALSQLAWPVLAGIVVWRIGPAVVRLFTARGFTIEVGGSKLTVQEASDLLRTQLYDLQGHVSGLRRTSGTATFAPSLASSGEDGEGRPSVVWIDPEPMRATHEAGVLRGNGLDVVQVATPDLAQSLLEESKGPRLIVVSSVALDPSRRKVEHLVEAIRSIYQRSGGHPIVAYADFLTVRHHREEFLQAGACMAVHSPIDLYEILDVSPQITTTEFDANSNP